MLQELDVNHFRHVWLDQENSGVLDWHPVWGVLGSKLQATGRWRCCWSFGTSGSAAKLVSSKIDLLHSVS